MCCTLLYAQLLMSTSFCTLLHYFATNRYLRRSLSRLARLTVTADCVTGNVKKAASLIKVRLG